MTLVALQSATARYSTGYSACYGTALQVITVLLGHVPRLQLSCEGHPYMHVHRVPRAMVCTLPVTLTTELGNVHAAEQSMIPCHATLLYPKY